MLAAGAMAFSWGLDFGVSRAKPIQSCGVTGYCLRRKEMKDGVFT
jgi:hypothetical protein